MFCDGGYVCISFHRVQPKPAQEWQSQDNCNQSKKKNWMKSNNMHEQKERNTNKKPKANNKDQWLIREISK